MTTNFTVKPFFLYRLQQEMRPEIPGFLLQQPTAHAMRGRREDQLIVYLAVSGRQAIGDEAVREMVARAADTFYQTGGSTTTALRAALQVLNEALRQMNVDAGEPGHYLAGRVVLAALRREALYVLLSGAVEIFALTAEGGQWLRPDERARRGLGLSQATPHSLARLTLTTPMKLLFCAQAPADWRRLLDSERAETPASIMADSLLQMSGEDLHAVLLEVEKAAAAPKRDKRIITLPVPRQPQAAETALRWLQRGREMRQRAQRFLARLLPFSAGQGPADGLSARLLLLLAIVIPLLVAFSASTIYLRRGLQAQAKAAYARAEALAVQARREANPVLQREAWQEVLQNLEQADALMALDDTPSLRREAQDALDELDGVLRVNFVEARLDLPAGAHIVSLTADEEALYLLDATANAVYRARRTAGGYRLDAGFLCRQSKQQGQLVALLQVESWDGVLVLDDRGRGLHCQPGLQPADFNLPPTNRGELRVDAAAWRDGFLYVLDRQARAVWIYPPDENGALTRPPLYFFDATVPDLEHVRAMAVYGGELFLLNEDSTLTICQYSLLQTVPNRCEEGVMLRDTRPGYTDAVRIPGTRFSQLQVTPPPNTALLVLDGENRAIYRFSPQTRLLQNVLKAPVGTPPAGQAWSAFYVTPDAVLVIAIGEHLYFAPHIP